MRYALIFSLMLLCGWDAPKCKPTLWLIGDSTVKNGSGKGEGGLWGWGDLLHEQFDTTRVRIVNRARGGRSSRTYLSEGLWDKVFSQIKEGDFVLMQFGHNDGGPVNDTLRARGSIKGIGEETEEIDNLITKKHEVVHTFGWYLRRYIRDTKSKGATPIVCSLVARNVWAEGKVVRASDSYTLWTSQVAKEESAPYIDLNNAVATKYEQLGTHAANKLFLTDHTHTNLEGAKISAAVVAAEIQKLKKVSLKKYVKH